jgi:Mg-chelatase subunit ChlD
VGELDEDAVRDAAAEDLDDTLTLLMAMSRATDEQLRRRVAGLVPRLIIDRARYGARHRIGASQLKRVRADRGGDLDIDSSLEAIAEARAFRRPPAVDELTAYDWQKPRTAICLLIDRSGSMEGTRLATAAMAAASCALRAEHSRTELSVIAFDSRTQVLLDLAAPCRADVVVDQVLGLRGFGTTSLDAALRAAEAQLAGARANRRITLLLSDCRVTDDTDPLPAARAHAELLVVAPASDDEEAVRFARAAGARVASLDTIDGLPGVLEGLLAH